MAKSAKQEKARLNRLVVGMEKDLQRSFMLFIRSATSTEVMSEVTDLLEAGKIGQAMAIVDKHIANMGRALHRVMSEAGVDEAKNLSNQLGPALASSFDPGNQRAARIMRENQLRFDADLRESQRQAIRQALVRALTEGKSGRDSARAFRDAIGLNAQQEAAVSRYAQLLSEGNASRAEALRRQLRDKRFDDTVRNSIKNNRPLSQAEIDKMVGRYRDRARQARAEMIGRTEATNAFGVGREEALRQVTENAGIDTSRIVRTWNSTGDGRTRDTHSSMNQQKRGMNEAFQSPSKARIMYPGDRSAPASETIHCRCVVTNSVKAP